MRVSRIPAITVMGGVVVAGAVFASMVTSNSQYVIPRAAIDSGDSARPQVVLCEVGETQGGLRIVPNVAEAICSADILTNSVYRVRVGLLTPRSALPLDCNDNGIPDECDIAGGTSRDCNSNGIPDECDIAGGTSTDSDTDGIPDECVPVFITGGRSCRGHGPSTFCLDLGPGDGQMAEVRVGGVTRLELDLSAPMDAASVLPQNVQVDCGTQGILTELLGDMTVVISFQPGLLDLTCCEVRLDGMLSQQGLPVANGYLVATLIGDVNRDGGVSSSDAGSVEQRLGTVVDANNFRYDVNADGSISSADYASVTQRLGNVAAVCP